MHLRNGFLDRQTGIGRISRIWPTETLITLFEDAAIPVSEIGSSEERECIILRDENGNNIEYTDDENTIQKRDLLRNYNALLKTVFIDIPYLNDAFEIEHPNLIPERRSRLQIQLHEKFVYRVFNRSSFELGGRFYGGWWQGISQENRGRIFMDDWPVSEIDYSGLHIALLYAEQNINYWDELGFDPYVIPTPDFVLSDHHCRDICKKLLLVGINSQNDRSTFGAFRQQAPNGSYQKRLTNPELLVILNSLRDLHPVISGSIASDAGIRLMNTDSHITARILDHFTQQAIPVLPIHDSYLIPYGMEHELTEAMNNEPPPVCRRLQSKYGWSPWKKVTEPTDFRLRCVPARFG